MVPSSFPIHCTLALSLVISIELAICHEMIVGWRLFDQPNNERMSTIFPVKMQCHVKFCPRKSPLIRELILRRLYGPNYEM